MSVTTRTAMARLIVWLLTLCMLLSTLPPVRAQGGDGQGGGTGISIATAQCERPPLCFASVEARQSWARDNNCYFLEDVCSEAPQDDGGARAEDRGFWGSLWDKGVAGIKYGYNFLRGLFDGLKDQIEGIVELITNAADVVKWLIEIGKAFYNDPEGPTMALAELMGQGAVNLITRATECGPYDLGRVIGEWVSPAVMVRVATRLGRYGDDVVAAVRNTKRDLGCASFAAGTLIWTEDGLAPIERVGIGERLLARDDRLWHDAPQRVAMTFERVAPNYHELRTELETYRVTDEHPLWVQGKGWTEVSQITEQDVLVLRHGDARVLANTRVDEPVEVYNFTVENTPNYFVGEHGLWAHNCNAVPGGGLAAHEAAGGHLIARHVGINERQLIDRLNADARISAASSFSSRAIAEYAVSTALLANRSQIDEFLAGSSTRLVISHNLQGPVGIVVQRGATSAQPASGVRVVIDKDASMPNGYRIVTGFPTP